MLRSYALSAVIALLLSSSVGCAAIANKFEGTGSSTPEPDTTAAEVQSSQILASPQVLGTAARPDTKERIVQGGKELVDTETTPKPPLRVSVAQAFYVGQRLHLKIHVRAKTKISTDEILVSVLGLHEGQIVETHSKTAREVHPVESLNPDQAVLIPFVLERTDLTEYQIVCAWGDDAKVKRAEVPSASDSNRGSLDDAVVQASEGGDEQVSKSEDTQIEGAATGGSKGQSSAATGILLEEVVLEEQVQACAGPPCDIRYIVHARLRNADVVAIKGVQIAVGLAWAEGGGLAKPPQDYALKVEGEDVVDLLELELPAGSSKKMRISVDRAVPVVPGGAFIPYIRLLSVGKP